MISSLIFGAFHMSLVKLLPTAVLGACFAYIGCISGSIYIGMALHFLNNFLSMAAMEYPDQAGKVLPILMKTQLSAGELTGMLVIGLLCGAAGVLILGKGKQVKASE